MWKGVNANLTLTEATNRDSSRADMLGGIGADKAILRVIVSIKRAKSKAGGRSMAGAWLEMRR